MGGQHGRTCAQRPHASASRDQRRLIRFRDKPYRYAKAYRRGTRIRVAIPLCLSIHASLPSFIISLCKTPCALRGKLYHIFWRTHPKDKNLSHAIIFFPPLDDSWIFPPRTKPFPASRAKISRPSPNRKRLAFHRQLRTAHAGGRMPLPLGMMRAEA